MRKIITFTHATLDGYIDAPHEWSLQYSDEELQDYGLEMTLATPLSVDGRAVGLGPTPGLVLDAFGEAPALEALVR